MSKQGCIIYLNGRDYEIGRNDEGWFACDLEVAGGASSDYYGSERELVEAIEKGEAVFT